MTLKEAVIEIGKAMDTYEANAWAELNKHERQHYAKPVADGECTISEAIREFILCEMATDNSDYE